MNKGISVKLTKQQQERLKTTVGIALSVLAVAGIVTLSAVAPNLIGAIGKLHKLNKRYHAKKPASKRQLEDTIYYLRRQGYVQLRGQKSDLTISLTSRGKRKLKQLQFDTLYIPAPKKWDGYWWQVAADIPTKHYRMGADALRRKLKQLGFYSLQRTLWFYPHNPTREINYIIQSYGIGSFVTVMKVAELDKEDEHRMKKFFTQNKVL